MHQTEEALLQRLAPVYRELLDTLLDKPELFARVINERITTLVPSHGMVLILDSENDDRYRGTAETVAHVQVGRLQDTESASVWLEQMERGNDFLERLCHSSLDELERQMRLRHPDFLCMHTAWVTGKGTPDVAFCICRAETATNNMGAFTDVDNQAIQFIAPHLITLVRMYAEITRVRRASFDFFAQRCAELGADCNLTSAEQRVLRMMVDGESNKTICAELGVSLATVKTHISHILQKTGCRNRSDIIGRYFSSKYVAAPS